jgi:hypothetical protein
MAKNPVPSANTPKATTADGKYTIPSAYEFREFQLQNSYGDKYNIASYVIGLDLVEELYSPTVVAKIFIRDNDNFFENARLNGQEIITFNIRKYFGTEYEDLSATFVVKEYPDFSKTAESLNVQEYSIVAVSTYSYLSRLQQISRSVSGNPVDLIQKIFSSDLAYPNFNNEVNTHPCTTVFKGVITRRTPLQAVKWLKDKAYDENKTPFFVYSTISDPRVAIRSWTSIVDPLNRFYPSEDQPYRIRPYSQRQPGTQEALKEARMKILSMKSSISLDKLSAAANGGFGNTMNIIDYSNRVFQQKKFTPAEAGVELSDDGSLKGSVEDASDDGFAFLKHLGIDTQKFTSMINASDYDLHLPIPSGESGSNARNSAEIKAEYSQSDRHYRSNLESVSHEISLYGDFKLNPAKKIRIEIPKAVDPKKLGPTETVLDLSLSGTYVVAVSVHSFRNGVYTSRLKLIKDNA